MLSYQELANFQRKMREKVQLNMVGGTIVSTNGSNGLTPGTAPQYRVMEYVPSFLRPYTTVQRTVDDKGRLINVDSTDLRFNQYDAIAKDIIEGVKNERYAQLVIQGTDTMPYAGRFFGMRLPFKDYFVGIVGSMRPIEDPNSDAPKNLEAAFVASQELAPGTYVFMNNGNILHATRVIKTRTHPRSYTGRAFESVNYPLLGRVKKGRIEFTKRGEDAHERFRRRQKERSFLKQSIQELYGGHDYPIYLDHHTPNSVYVFDQDPETSVREMEHAYRDGYKVMVIRAYGSGGITPEVQREIERWTKNDRYVLVTTQVPSGRIDSAYEVNRRATEAGAIPCYDMYTTTVEAKAKLAVALTDTADDFRKVMYYNFEDEMDDHLMPDNGPTTDDQFLEILAKDAKKHSNGKSVLKRAEEAGRNIGIF